MDGGRHRKTRTTPAPAVGQSESTPKDFLVPHLRSTKPRHLPRSSWAASTQTRQQSALQFKPPFPSPHPPHNTSHTSKASATMADYVIRNGLIVDGTGSAPCVSTAARCFLRSPAQFAKLPRPGRFIGDLAVKDGLITEVGTKLATTGAREIDATGKHVCSTPPSPAVRVSLQGLFLGAFLRLTRPAAAPRTGHARLDLKCMSRP